MARLKILVGMPLPQKGAMVSSSVMLSVAGVLSKSEHDVSFGTCSGTSIWRNREQLVKQALEKGCDYLWQVDSDMTYAPATLDRLVALNEGREGDAVLSGLAMVGHHPYHPAIYHEVMDQLVPYFEDSAFPFKVDAMGSYAMLTPCSVLEKVKDEFGTCFYPDTIQWRGQVLPLSEDLTFCRRARMAGFPIICDPSIEIHHLRPVAIGWDHFKGVGDFDVEKSKQPWSSLS